LGQCCFRKNPLPQPHDIKRQSRSCHHEQSNRRFFSVFCGAKQNGAGFLTEAALSCSLSENVRQDHRQSAPLSLTFPQRQQCVIVILKPCVADRYARGYILSSPGKQSGPMMMQGAIVLPQPVIRQESRLRNPSDQRKTQIN
jgi:hypothetical protein